MASAVISDVEFEDRMRAEDTEAFQVKCPLESCGAEVGERCCTEAGQPRIRHAKRLWEARRQAK